MAKAKDTILMDIYKYIENCNPSCGTTLSTKSTDSYDNLATELNSVTTSLGLKDTWDDEISVEINGGLKSGIDSMIASCKSPADQVISTVGISVEKLITSIKTYSDKVDEYNAQETALKNLGSCPSQYIIKDGIETYNSEYTAWQNNNSRIRGIMTTLEQEINTWKTSSDSLVTTIKTLLLPIGSEETITVLNTATGTTETYEGTPLEEFGYGEGYRISGTVIKDADGKIISETYYIINAENEVVQSGTITYNADGTKNIEKYIVKYEEPTTTAEIEAEKAELEKQGIPAEMAYLDENVTPEEEAVTTDTDIFPDENGEGDDFNKTEHREATYADGTEVVSDTTTTGSVDDETQALVPEHQTEDATITAADGTAYDYHAETEFENGQRDTTAATLSADGQVVAEVNTDYVAEYTDRNTGYDVSVTNEVVQTQETTTTTSRITYRENEAGQVYADEAVVVRDNADPACGSVTYSNGEGFTVERNENGDLVVTKYRTDKNGNIESDSEIITDQANAKFTFTNHQTGEQTVTNINISNPLDEFTVSNTYQTARIDTGYNPDAAMERINFLWLGDGTDVTVQSPWEEDPAYTMSLDVIGN